MHERFANCERRGAEGHAPARDTCFGVQKARVRRAGGAPRLAEDVGLRSAAPHSHPPSPLAPALRALQNTQPCCTHVGPQVAGERVSECTCRVAPSFRSVRACADAQGHMFRGAESAREADGAPRLAPR